VFKNHLKVAVRHLLRQKLYSGINILGLAIGLGVCFLVAGYIHHELSFENCHVNKDRIYRVINSPKNYFADHISNVPAPLAEALKDQCPEVEKITRLRPVSDVSMRVGPEVFSVKRMILADPEILDIYTLPLVRGNPATALDAPFKVLISESLARTRFGDADPVGSTVRLAGHLDCRVTGVLKDIPTNTQMRCDILGSYATLEAVGENTHDWGARFTDYVYLLLKDGARATDMDAKLPGIIAQNVDEESRARLNCRLQPLSETYLHSHGVNELRPTGELSLILTAATIALLVLIIGAINFVNLSTARSHRRSREAGLRKMFGAARSHLACQFLVESMAVSLVAMILAVILYELCKSWFGLFTGQQADLDPWYDPVFFVSMLAITLVVGLLAGAYPALVMTRFSPIASLRGGFRTPTGRSLARRGLVVFQFAVAAALIALTAIVYRQLHFCENREVGFAKEGIYILKVEDRDTERAAANCILLKDELLRTGAAVDATASFAAPGENRVWIDEFADAGQPEAEALGMVIVPVDYEYSDFYELNLLQGRKFSREYADDDDGRTLILTESSVRRFGLDSPIGARLATNDGEYTVVGVVADFNPLPANYQEFPIALEITPHDYSRVAVKLPSSDFQSSVNGLAAGWSSVFPDEPFRYESLENLISRVYEDSARLANMGVVFAGLAILVGCLGILGLAAHAVEQRTKEIGIRKVLGSSTVRLLKLFLSETVVLLIIANLVAAPAAWYLGNLWLERFAHKAAIELWSLVGGGAVVLLFAVVTVTSQVIRAARANPIEALRYE